MKWINEKELKPKESTAIKFYPVLVWVEDSHGDSQ